MLLLISLSQLNVFPFGVICLFYKCEDAALEKEFVTKLKIFFLLPMSGLSGVEY